MRLVASIIVLVLLGLTLAERSCFIKNGDDSVQYRLNANGNSPNNYQFFYGSSSNVNATIYGHKYRSRYFLSIGTNSSSTFQVFTWDESTRVGVEYQVSSKSSFYPSAPTKAQFDFVQCTSSSKVEKSISTMQRPAAKPTPDTFCYRVNGLGSSDVVMQLDKDSGELGAFYSKEIGRQDRVAYGYRDTYSGDVHVILLSSTDDFALFLPLIQPIGTEYLYSVYFRHAVPFEPYQKLIWTC